MSDGSTLPSKHCIDYGSILSAAQAESESNLVPLLREQLLVKWREVYLASVAHVTNIVHLRFGNFEYVFDHYSGLEAKGEVTYDQTIQDRVVGVFGTSARAQERRGAMRFRSWAGPTEGFAVGERDKGHFMAHCIGGGLDVNVFSQERRLNQGRSPQGKIYRQMERYCHEHSGTFCFSRPIYMDGSSVPRWLEFGLLREDETLWVEMFEN